MAMTVEASFDREFEVDCPYEVVFDFLADVPRTARHYPTLDKLVKLDENVYRWELQKVGIQQYYIQTIYANRYTSDKEEGLISWEPVEGEGNAEISGYWRLEALDDTRTRVHFHTEGKLHLPLPGLLKIVLAPLVIAEFSSQVDKFMANLQKAFAEIC